MPHFEIKLLEGKSEEQKKLLAKEIIKTARNGGMYILVDDENRENEEEKL